MNFWLTDEYWCQVYADSHIIRNRYSIAWIECTLSIDANIVHDKVHVHIGLSMNHYRHLFSIPNIIENSALAIVYMYMTYMYM
jgi:hypothetical protein